jgi:tetratricopeptide (TPR) repeat protein
MKRMHKQWVLKVLAWCVGCLGLVGCGGGSAAAGGAGDDTTARGVSGSASGGSTTASSTTALGAINDEARGKWAQADTFFRQNEKAGWTSSACEKASEMYIGAGKAQRGGLPEATFMAGLSLERCGKRDDASKLYRRALEQNPKLCKARVAIAVSAMEQGGTREAEAGFAQAIKDDPQCKEAYANLAMLQRSQGGNGPREALNNLRRALAIDASYLPAFNQMALLYLDQSQTNPQMIDLAGVVCRQAQLVDKDYAPIYNTWGLVHMRKGDVIEASRMFERAMQLDKNLFEAYMNFGQITLSFRGYQDAKSAFERAVTLRPRDYDAHIGLGVSLRGLKQAKDAEEQYAAAVSIDSSRPEAHYNLGVLHQDYMGGSVSELQQAKQHFQEFLSRARGGALEATVEEVRRTCQGVTRTKNKRKRLQAQNCRPGRLQNIDMALQALKGAGQ